MTHSDKDVLVVGGAVGGVRTAESLRRHGFEGTITVLEATDELPCDRPALSKTVLAGATKEGDAILRTEEELAGNAIEFRRGARAVGLDLDRRTVRTADGAEWGFGTLVVATGSRARRLPQAPGHPAIHHLRTMSDARLLRDRLEPGRDLVVVGAGFIGSEVAAVAVGRGVRVTIVEPFEAPLARVLGGRIGRRIAAVHEAHDVRARYGRTVTGIAEHTSGRLRVSLDDGTELRCDDVVVGIGAVPNTAWLEGSGLPVDDGLVVGADGRSPGQPVYAVGDVARFHHPLLGTSVRIEHWTNALEQAGVVAWNICNPDGPKQHGSVPFVWSEQYEHRLQIVGRPNVDDDLEVVEDDDPRMFAVFSRDGVVTGAFGLDTPREVLAVRRAMATTTPLRELLDGIASPA